MRLYRMLKTPACEKILLTTISQMKEKIYYRNTYLIFIILFFYIHERNETKYLFFWQREVEYQINSFLCVFFS